MAPDSPRAAPRQRWLLATLALLTLTGCFDVLQEVWLNPDGSARVVVDLAIPKSLGALAQATGGKDLMALVREQREEAAKKLGQDPNVTQVVQSDYEKDDQLHLVHDVTVKDATKLPELYRTVTEGTSREAQRGPGTWDLRIERSGGDYVFTQRFVPDQAAALPATDDAAELAAREIAKGMAKALFVKNHLTVRVHGPGIGETNGTVNEQKDTVEWKLPMAELMDAPAEGRELRAVVRSGEPLWLWPVVLGVPLAVLGLAISAARRRRAA
ncbi:hypothetical protein ACLESO_49020 [Pyxidicoccus sp. 3LG]